MGGPGPRHLAAAAAASWRYARCWWAGTAPAPRGDLAGGRYEGTLTWWCLSCSSTPGGNNSTRKPHHASFRRQPSAHLGLFPLRRGRDDSFFLPSIVTFVQRPSSSPPKPKSAPGTKCLRFDAVCLSGDRSPSARSWAAPRPGAASHSRRWRLGSPLVRPFPTCAHRCATDNNLSIEETFYLATATTISLSSVPVVGAYATACPRTWQPADPHDPIVPRRLA